MTTAQNHPKVSGKRTKGQAYTTPTGERRIRLVDLKKLNARNDDVYEVKLSDIILGGVTFEGPDDQEVRLCPLNMKGMSALEKLVGGDLNALATQTVDLEMTIKIATVLINQDRPVDEHVTEDEVGRMMTPEVMGIVNEVIGEMVRPLFAPDDQDTDQTATTAGA